MHAALDQLMTLAQAHGDVVALNPPLPPTIIHTTLATAALPWCADLLHLYTWANGTIAAASAPLFRDRGFLPLKAAVDSHTQLAGWAEEFVYRGLDIARAVPFAAWDNRAFLVYVGDVGLLRHPILSIADTLTIEYKDLPALVATCSAWWQLREPEAELRDLGGPTWYAQNRVAGDPQYIDRLNQSQTSWIADSSSGRHTS